MLARTHCKRPVAAGGLASVMPSPEASRAMLTGPLTRRFGGMWSPMTLPRRTPQWWHPSLQAVRQQPAPSSGAPVLPASAVPSIHAKTMQGGIGRQQHGGAA